MMIKICGVSRPEDAYFAAQAGATHVGMILWSQARRYVDRERAKEIACSIKEGGAQAVGVFVEGSHEKILETAEFTGIDHIQLTGTSVEAYPKLIKSHDCIVSIPVSDPMHIPEIKIIQGYVLYDHGIGGSGKSFCWETFQPPQRRPWILAGGLNIDNVAKAIRMLKPDGVDVSSGVETCAGKKDHRLIKAFIENAKREMTNG